MSCSAWQSSLILLFAPACNRAWDETNPTSNSPHSWPAAVDTGAPREVTSLPRSTALLSDSARRAAPARVGAARPARAVNVRTAQASARTDSARGAVILTGSCNGGFTMLSLGNDKAVILDGYRALYAQLSGVELVVSGRRLNGPFPWPVQSVDSFVVRASQVQET